MRLPQRRKNMIKALGSIPIFLFHFLTSFPQKRKTMLTASILFFKNSRPKNAKKHAISLLQMQASFTTQNQECIYLPCLILMYKEIKSKSFNAPLLSIKRRVICRCKRHEAKRLQTKHALKAVRYERKQVETCSNKNSIKENCLERYKSKTLWNNTNISEPPCNNFHAIR
jgi:hypothetical protein